MTRLLRSVQGLRDYGGRKILDRTDSTVYTGGPVPVRIHFPFPSLTYTDDLSPGGSMGRDTETGGWNPGEGVYRTVDRESRDSGSPG